MSLGQDIAICLRRRDYSESSQIVTLFARELGKLRAIAKGARRPRSPFAGGVDPLTAGHIGFALPRGDSTLATLTRFELVHPFAGLRRSLLGLHCAQYAAELLDAFTEEQDPHPALYDAFHYALDAWQEDPRPEAILLAFELALFREIGLAPDFRHCGACRRPLAPDRRLYFSSSLPGMLCPNCEPAVAEKRFLEPAALACLQRPETIAQADPRAVLDAHELLGYHQRELLHRPPRTMEFVNKLLRRHRSA